MTRAFLCLLRFAFVDLKSTPFACSSRNIPFAATRLVLEDVVLE